MYDTPNTALSILFKHSTDLVGLREIGSMAVDDGALPVPISGVCGEGLSGELLDPSERLWMGVVQVIYRDNLVLASLL